AGVGVRRVWVVGGGSSPAARPRGKQPARGANPPLRTTVAPANTSALVEAPAAANPSAMPAAETIPSLRSTIDSRARSRQPFRSSIRRARCNHLLAGLELVYADPVTKEAVILLRGTRSSESRQCVGRPGALGSPRRSIDQRA